MKTLRSLSSLLIRGLVAAVFSASLAYGISKEDLAALRENAENGNGIAQYNLGLLYATSGESIADPIEAYVWFNLAADNGATGRALVMLNSQLSKEQVAEAKRRLEIRRTELEAKRKSTSAASPVSAVEPSPSGAETSSPIVAAPAAPEPPISAGPVSEREFSTLQAELKKMSNELSDAWKENERLKAATAKGTPSTAATDQLQHDRDQLRTALASSNEEVAKMRGEARNFETERNGLQQKISASQAQKESIGAELAATTTKLRAGENQLAQATAASRELVTAKQNLATLEEQVQKLTAENQRLPGLAAQASSAAEMKAQADKEQAAWRTALSTAQTQLAAAKIEAEAGGTARKQLEETQSKLESSLRSFDSQKKEGERLQKALVNSDAEREGLAKQLADAKAAANRPDPASELRIAKLTTELETARASGRQVAQLQKLLADSQAKLKAADDDLASANQAKDQLGKQLAAAQASPAAAPGEITRLNTELSDARGRSAAAERALAQAKDDREHGLQEAARANQQQVGQLTAQLLQLRQKSAASEDALAKAQQERDALRPQVAAAAVSAGEAAEAASLRTRLKSVEEALAGARAERDALAERLGAAENKANAAIRQAVAAVPPTGDDPTELRKELVETQAKLSSALRTYQLQQDEVDRLQKTVGSNEADRAQLAHRLHDLDTQAAQAQAQASTNLEATGQLTAAREQLRQAQNQIASLAGENAQLKDRISATAPSLPGAASVAGVAPSRPVSIPAPSVAPVSRPTTPAPPTRPPAPAAPRTHTVGDGDTLTKIARRYYGTSERWPQILEANRAVIKDVNNLTVGTTLKIP